MFYYAGMQLGLDIGAPAAFAAIRDELSQNFGPYELTTPREPAGQLVKSMISSRTYDAVSAAAYERLIRRFPTWPDLAAASAAEIEAVIFDVTWPAQKAAQLIAALRLIHAERPNYDLRFLRRGSVSQGLAWLEALPGVGRKISASTLNFSTLTLPALVIDTHVLRVLKRLRLVGPRADTEAAYDNVMRSLGSWSAAELQALHVLVKFLGQTFCHASGPDRSRCPIFGRCGGVSDRLSLSTSSAEVRTDDKSASEVDSRRLAQRLRPRPSNLPLTQRGSRPDINLKRVSALGGFGLARRTLQAT